jgi:hypothetical protein
LIKSVLQYIIITKICGGVWNETVGGETVRKVYGTEPIRRSGESEIHFQVRYNRYKMTPQTAQMFSGIYQEEEKRLGARPRVVGSHICFGDLPRTVTSAARRKIEQGRLKDAARGIPRSPQHQPGVMQ